MKDSSTDENPYTDTGFETNGSGLAFNELVHDIDNGLDLDDLECSAFVIFGVSFPSYHLSNIYFRNSSILNFHP